MEYKLWPHSTTPAFRSLVTDTYPGLNKSPIYWHLMEHCLFGGRRHDHADDRCQLILTQAMVAEMVGSNKKNVNASTWIADFERDTAIRLNASDYSFTGGQARSIHPEIDPVVLAARDQECLAEFRGAVSGWVDFATGNPVSARRRSKALADHHDECREGAAAASIGHPATELIRILNEQHPGSLSHRVKQNCEALITMAEALEPGPRQDGVYRVLHAIGQSCLMIYSPTERSTRLFCMGDLTVNSFPRDFRLVALSGDVHLDLRCSQLAIATRLLPLPGLKAMLRSSQSFWTYILDELSLPHTYKSVLKPAIYSVLFGMSKRNLREWLLARMPERAVDLFFRNSFVQDILEQRGRAYRQIGRDGGIYDAFGVWLAVSKERRPHQLFCAAAQSYEMKMMLAALPILIAHKGSIHIHSWLHDSLTLAFRIASEESALVAQIAAAINSEALRLGVPTEIEATK